MVPKSIWIIPVLIFFCSSLSLFGQEINCVDAIDNDFDGPIDCADTDCFPNIVFFNHSNFNGYNISCNGASDGHVEVMPFNPVNVYVYSWDNGDSGPILTGVPSGTYTVFVQDVNTLCTNSFPIFLDEPSALGLTANAVDVTCNGANDGSINLTPSGGVSPYTFDWAHIAGSVNSQNISGLAPGSYDVIMTDANGCTLPASATISEPSVLNMTSSDTDVSCNGGSDGAIDVNTLGGNSPYTHDWDHIGGANNGEDLSGLAAGTYDVTVTDVKGCTAVLSITLSEPTVLSLSTSKSDVLCNGASNGSIDLTVSGGTPPYTNDWSHIGGSNNSEDVSGLSPTSYSVIVTDDNGCTASTSVTINEPDAIALPYTQDNVSCNGNSDGSIDLSPTGGTTPYTFNWSHIAGTDDGEDVGSLVAGTYTVTLTDGNFCTESTSITVTEPDVLVLSRTFTDVLCNGAADGSIDVTTSGGTAPFTFDWDHIVGSDDGEDVSSLAPGTYNVTVTDANSCTSSTSATIVEPTTLTVSETHIDASCGGYSDGSIDLTIAGGTTPYNIDWDHIGGPNNSEDLTGIDADTYDATITDDNGCTVSISITIDEPTPINTSFSIVEPLCNGDANGSIDLSVSGGTPGYSFDWDNDGTGDIDDNEDISSITANTYTVIVYDGNGCSKTQIVPLTEPGILLANLSITETSCSAMNDGTATSNPLGGTAPFLYSWNTTATTQTITGLVAGNYQVVVTDDNGCQNIDDIDMPLITILTVSPSVISNYSGYDISCAGASDGFAAANAAEGTTPYSYLWSNTQNTGILSNVSDGTYSVTVTDGRGCTESANVTLTDPPSIDISFNITSDYNGRDIECNGDANGSVEGTPSGGIGAFTYLWNTTATTNAISGITAGTYTLTVTDSEDCVYSEDITLTEPDAMNVTLTTSDYDGYEISCAGASDGWINTTVTGGTAPYSYSWNSGPTSANLSGIPTGYYSVTVSDANDCEFTIGVSMDEPPVMSFTTSTAAPTDCGVDDGIISISAIGGVGTYEYSLDNVTYQTGDYFTGLATGSYTVYVRNGLGTCTSSQIVIIPDAEAPTIDNIVIINPSTGVSTDGAILVQASGSGISLQYSLDGVSWQSSNLFENLSVGSYTVRVRYAGQNCESTSPVTLVAGGGIVGGSSATQDCSADLSGTSFGETYFIPVPESQGLTALSTIYPSSCSSTLPASPITSYNSIGVVEDGTIIHFDHWEDGYESNLEFPVQASTEIWGDGNNANGIPPGFATDILSAGDIIILYSSVDTSTPLVVDYDGRDKFSSFGDLSFSRMIWSTGPDSYFAGALEVYATEKWDTLYQVPVGESGLHADIAEMFEYTGVAVMAMEDGTSLTIAGGAPIALNQGESVLQDNLAPGDLIVSNKPVQAHLLTGDECASYESRFFSLTSPVNWNDRYYNPVSSSSTYPTFVIYFNPGSSSITVTFEDNGGFVNTRSVPAGGTNYVELTDNSGSLHYTSDGSPFYALACIDADGGSDGHVHDWGYALLPYDQISGQITLVGFAPGSNPLDLPTENHSPIWITGDHPNGSAFAGNNITISIDRDGNGTVDETRTFGELAQETIYDTSDDDQTGMKIWVSDGSDAFISGAWGLDPANGAGAKGLDLGTGLFNKVPFGASTCVELFTDYLENDIYDECDEVKYTITLRNTGSLPLAANTIVVTDTLPSELSYLEGTSVAYENLNVTAISDDIGPSTPFPFDESGFTVPYGIAAEDSIVITFIATIDPTASSNFVQNIVNVQNENTLLIPEVSFPLQNPSIVTIPGIPNDTIYDCDQVIPSIPFGDTCLTKITLNQSLWAVLNVSSQETVTPNQTAEMAFDDDPSTFWHTKYSGGDDAYPHTLDIDLGASHDFVNGIYYLPRQDAAASRIGNYEIYTSTDGVAWGTAVATGTWPNSTAGQQVDFTSVTARYIRLKALTAAAGGNYAGAAELVVFKCANDVVFNETNTRTSDGSCTDFAYDITRTWTVTNFCGNVGNEIQNITVQDTLKPDLFGVPTDITVTAGNVPAPPSVTASDNCDPTLNVVYNQSTAPNGCDTEHTRTWTVADECGNTRVGTQVITELTCDEDCTDTVDNDGDGDIDCADSDCFLSLSLDLTSDTTICSGNSILLTATPSGGTTPYVISWDNGLPNGTSHTVSPPINTTYTATVTDGNNCNTNVSVTVTVNNAAITGFQLNNLGAGSDVTLVNSGTYDFNSLPDFFNLEALISGTASSLDLNLSGAAVSSEIDNASQYILDDDFTAFSGPAGTYTFSADAYTYANAQGQQCDAASITFTLIGEEICGNSIDDNGDGRTDEPGPGGVHVGLNLWLKADVGTNTAVDGANINSWADQSPFSYDANADVGCTDFPTFKTEAINYNPAIEFDGVYSDNLSDGLHLGSNYIYSENDGMTTFAVVKPTGTPTTDKYFLDFGSASAQGYGLRYSSAHIGGHSPTIAGGANMNIGHSFGSASSLIQSDINFNGTHSILRNGVVTNTSSITLASLTASSINEDNAYSAGSSTQGPFSIGRLSMTAGLNTPKLFSGYVSEVLVFTKKLTALEKQKIRSYLAIKYGLTLAHDYLDSQGCILKSLDDGFNGGIACIAKDDISGLDQRRSKSTGLLSEIKLWNSNLSDDDFISLSHNGDSEFLEEEIIVSDTRFFTSERTWKIESPNTGINVDLSFELQQNIEYILISDSPDFHQFKIIELEAEKELNKISLVLSKDIYFKTASDKDLQYSQN